MINEKYACAYTEVIEVLKYTKRDDVNKIPKDIILLWKENMKKDYNFKIDESKNIEEQNLSKEAKAILANIFKKYWATDYQKERIEAKEKYDLEKIEKEKNEKYNPDDIFKTRNKKEEIETKENDDIGIIKYKESIFKRCIKKIKQILKIK